MRKNEREREEEEGWKAEVDERETFAQRERRWEDEVKGRERD